MALFDIFKGKKDKDIPVPQPEPNPKGPDIVDNSYPDGVTWINPGLSPWEKLAQQAKTVYVLTFRDAYSGRSLTDYFAVDTPLYSIIDRMEQENILSFPKRYIAIPGVESLERRGSHFPDVNDIPGVSSGITLDVDVRQANNPRLSRSPHFRKSYPLVFYRMENKVCVEKIEFVGYGYESAEDIVSRMIAEDAIPYSPEIRYNVLFWPTNKGTPTPENKMGEGPMPYNVHPLHLCEINPKPGTVYILQDYIKPWEPPMCMYGCPSAALPEQKSILASCCTDILTFE